MKEMDMSAKKKKNNFIVQGGILAVASILVRIIGMVYRIPLKQTIGSEGMGYYSCTYEIYNMALIISSYSLPLAVSKLVAARSVKYEHRNAYRVFLCGMIYAIIIGSVGSLAVFFGADFLAGVFKYGANVALPLRILSPMIVVFSVMGVLRGFYQGKNTMIPTAVSQIIEQIANAVVSVGAAYILMQNYSMMKNVAAYGAAGGTLGSFVGGFFGLLFLLFVFVQYKPILNKQLRSDITAKREGYRKITGLLMMTIIPVVLSQTVYQISGLIDIFIYGNVLNPKVVSSFDQSALRNYVHGMRYTKEIRATLTGIYSGEYRLLTNVPISIASSMGAAIVTSIAAAKAKGMIDVVKNKIDVAVKINMFIAIPSAVGLGVLAFPIIHLLFPDPVANTTSANFMYLGSVSIIFFSLSTVTSAALQGISQMRLPVINSAISLGIHIVLVFCLLKFTSLGTYSLIIGNVTFALVACVLNRWSLQKHLGYRQEKLKTFVIPLVSSGLMGVVAHFSYMYFYGLFRKNIIALLAAILIAMVVYFLLLIFLHGLEEEELEILPKGGTLVRILKKLHLL
jgi:stage V sporulation protein B